MIKKRILILGAGLTGLSAAWHLQERGIDCKVFEKESEVGGLCRSKTKKGFTFDYDGHLLHFRNKHSLNLVKKVLSGNLVKHHRNALVYSHNRYIPYPFQANLHNLPSEVIKDCLNGLIQASKCRNLGKNKKDLNFLEWINQNFGKGIAEHFMVPYNSKFWGVSPEELTCQWLGRFIPVPKVNEIIAGAKKRNCKPFGYNACFWYPQNGGISELPRALAKQLKNIHLNLTVKGIDLKKKEVSLSTGNKEKYDYLISTIPLPELPGLLKEIPERISDQFKKLRWNSIFNLSLGLAGRDNLKRHWIYFSQKDISFFRVGFFHNFSYCLAPQGNASLYISVAYAQDKPFNRVGIIAQIKEDLRKTGILNGEKIITQHINDIKYGYPIYDFNYNTATKEILGFLQKNKVTSCGRYGAWRYLSMEDAMLDGQAAAKGIIS
ncbi:MAG: FAD-dependent oxidoreductase [Candidatus Omnitrophica bacterium]|nr:FAD-dependent oxidoreductase [Candidatus Omnitrophota bacterium]